MLREYQFCGNAFRELNEEPLSSRNSEKPFQNSSCDKRMPLSSSDSSWPAFVSSLGSQTPLHVGAVVDSAMRHRSISRPQKVLLAFWLSQLMTLRYSWVTWRATQRPVRASRAAA